MLSKVIKNQVVKIGKVKSKTIFLKNLREIRSILVTINTCNYDVLIWIYHRLQSTQNWGGPRGAIAVEGALTRCHEQGRGVSPEDLKSCSSVDV